MNNDPKIIVGKNIKLNRLKIGITQEKLAELSGLHRTYIGSIERGERNVSLLNITTIARALKVQPSSLLENID